MTLKDKQNHYNVKFLKGYSFSINVKDTKIFLKHYFKNPFLRCGLSLFFIYVIVSSVTIIPSVFGIIDTSPPSPRYQFQQGKFAFEIKCNEGLVVVIKKGDSSPACVKVDTSKKLAARGWALSTEQMVWFEYDRLDCKKTPWELLYSYGMPSGESDYAKSYFRENGITVLDAKMTLITNSSSTVCQNQPQGSAFYFLVSQSDEDKMINLGYKMKLSLPSYPPYLCPSIDIC